MADVSVDDILLVFQSEEILYFVDSPDPGAGKARLFAIPVHVLGWNAENKIVTIDPPMLIQAPNFKFEEYPITVVPGWDADSAPIGSSVNLNEVGGNPICITTKTLCPLLDEPIISRGHILMGFANWLSHQEQKSPI